MREYLYFSDENYSLAVPCGKILFRTIDNNIITFYCTAFKFKGDDLIIFVLGNIIAFLPRSIIDETSIEIDNFVMEIV